MRDMQVLLLLRPNVDVNCMSSSLVRLVLLNDSLSIGCHLRSGSQHLMRRFACAVCICFCFCIGQVPIEFWHLLDVLHACTDQSHIALEVLRLNEELDSTGLMTTDLKSTDKMYLMAKMYTMALEASETIGFTPFGV